MACRRARRAPSGRVRLCAHGCRIAVGGGRRVVRLRGVRCARRRRRGEPHHGIDERVGRFGVDLVAARRHRHHVAAHGIVADVVELLPRHKGARQHAKAHRLTRRAARRAARLQQLAAGDVEHHCRRMHAARIAQHQFHAAQLRRAPLCVTTQTHTRTHTGVTANATLSR
jgi:hypothetical protein